MSRPLIQIDDVVREMNDDEYAEYLRLIESVNKEDNGNG